VTSRYFHAALLLAVIAAPANAEVRAWLDSTRVAPGDTVQLTLAHDGRTSTQPDLSPLRQDFDIIARSTSTNVQIVNGSVSSSTQLLLTLSPKHAGRLTVPSVTWDADHSAPLTLDVSGSANGNANLGAGAADNRVILETEVSPKDPYVQAEVVVTVRLYTAVPLSRASLEFGDTDAAIVRQNGADSEDTRDRNGLTYQVITRHYIVFPQRSGLLSIPGPILSGEIPVSRGQHSSSDPFADFLAGSPFSSMLGHATKPLRLRANPIQLDVRPRPTGAGTSYWLPAGNVSLQASWHPGATQMHVGDPITVDLDLKALGLTAAQLPDLSTQLNLPPGMKAYPDQPVLKDAPQNGEILGERQQSVALIADEPGQYAIPDLHLTWWNTHHNRPEDALLPGRTLAVQPAAESSTTAHGPVRTSQSTQTVPPPSSDRAAPSPSKTENSRSLSLRGPWPWISLGFALLWLVTLAALLRIRRGRGPSTTAAPSSTHSDQAENINTSGAKSAFHHACRANDALGARRSLLAWVNSATRGASRIRGLNALADTIGDPRLTELLRALDRACYAGVAWNGETLGKALRNLPKSEPSPEQANNDLAPLYH
jgi:BatD DUF11 like domain